MRAQLIVSGTSICPAPWWLALQCGKASEAERREAKGGEAASRHTLGRIAPSSAYVGAQSSSLPGNRPESGGSLRF